MGGTTYQQHIGCHILMVIDYNIYTIDRLGAFCLPYRLKPYHLDWVPACLRFNVPHIYSFTYILLYHLP